MGRKKRAVKPLETIRELPDELWARIEPILLEDAPPPPPAKGGRKRTDWRQAFNGIIFRLRTGCQWNRLPERFGDDGSVHRWFQRGNKNGVMERVWAVLVEGCGEPGGVSWEWQSADGAMGKARFGGDKVGPNPTDRGKNGVKRRVIVDQDGGPWNAPRRRSRTLNTFARTRATTTRPAAPRRRPRATPLTSAGSEKRRR